MLNGLTDRDITVEKYLVILGILGIVELKYGSLLFHLKVTVSNYIRTDYTNVLVRGSDIIQIY